MNLLYGALDRKDSLIKSLKISNQKRQTFIDNLIEAGVEKDNEIAEFKRQLRLLEGVVDRLRKKQGWTIGGKKNKGQGG